MLSRRWLGKATPRLLSPTWRGVALCSCGDPGGISHSPAQQPHHHATANSKTRHHSQGHSQTTGLQELRRQGKEANHSVATISLCCTGWRTQLSHHSPERPQTNTECGFVSQESYQPPTLAFPVRSWEKLGRTRVPGGTGEALRDRQGHGKQGASSEARESTRCWRGAKKGPHREPTPV